MNRDELKALIKERFGTYEKLAAEIGVSIAAISEIVNGRTTSATARYSVAKALGCDVRDIWPDVPAAA